LFDIHEHWITHCLWIVAAVCVRKRNNIRGAAVVRITYGRISKV